MNTNPVTPPKGEFEEKIQKDDNDNISNKQKLASKLEKRPHKEQLVHQNILKAIDTDPGLQEQVLSLLKEKTKNQLQHKLAERSSPQQLINQNIMIGVSDGTTSEQGAHYQIATKQLLKHITENNLSSFLSNRPSLEHIMESGLAQETMIWSRVLVTGPIPSPRNCHSINLIGSYLYLWGGFGISRTSELYVYDIKSSEWNRPLVTGVVPRDRYAHTMSQVGRYLILFGGFAADQPQQWLNDTHVLDTDCPQAFIPALGQSTPTHTCLWYRPTVKGFIPPPRAAHTAIVFEKKIYIFGGNNGEKVFNDLYVFNTNNMEWSQIKDVKGNIPTARSGHTATLYLNYMIIFGGAAGETAFNDVHILNLHSLEWSTPVCSGTVPNIRAGHCTELVWNYKLLVFGGGFYNKVFHDLFILDLKTWEWSRPSDSGTLPSPRGGHSCTNYNNQLLIFGGGDIDGDIFNDLYQLDISFLRLPSQNSPVMSHRRKISGFIEEEILPTPADDPIALSILKQINFNITQMQSNYNNQIEILKKTINENIDEHKQRVQKIIEYFESWGKYNITQLSDLSQSVDEMDNRFKNEFNQINSILEYSISSTSIPNATTQSISHSISPKLNDNKFTLSKSVIITENEKVEKPSQPVLASNNEKFGKPKVESQPLPPPPPFSID